MLRLVLEQSLRTVASPTFVFSYIPSTASSEASFDWQDLAQALATDLFVQALERFDNFRLQLEQQQETLSRLWYTAIPDFGRQLKRYIEKTAATTDMSAWWWRTWQRPAWRYTPLTQERQAFLQGLIEQGRILKKVKWNGDAAQGLLVDSLALLQAIGYENTFLLLDVAPTHSSQEPTAGIQQIFSVVAGLPRQIVIKAFLPIGWRSDLTLTDLTTGFFSPIIEWGDPGFLNALIYSRFRSAGSRIRGFDAIASQEFAGQLQATLIQEASHSPRRFLQLASSLIDAHASRDPQDPFITQADWRQMQRDWSYGSPVPSRPAGEEPVMRSEYTNELWVQRERELSQIESWVETSKRLLTVAGPPGVGKTWLLRHWEHTKKSAGATTLFWDLTPLITTDKIDQPQALQELRQLVKRINSQAPAYNSRVEPPAMAEALGRALCQREGEVFICMDGGEALPQSGWRTFERAILEPLARLSCLRFLIPVRDEMKVQAANLRWSEQRLELGVLDAQSNPVSPKGKEQIEKLLTALPSPSSLPTVDQIIALVPGYPWSHAGLNAFLFRHLEANEFHQLSAKWCHEGLLEVLELQSDPAFDEAFEWVSEIVSYLSETWTVDAWARHRGEALRRTWDRVVSLQRQWWVTNLSGSQYKVADGVREYVAACQSHT